MDKQFLERRILPKVKKPLTYCGNEIGSVHKILMDETIRFAFAFPDIYEIGMSHLGLKILYALMNDISDVACERVFAPWDDMETMMRENNIPLFALESQDPIKEFDFIGFTLQYEMSYSNILNMLDLAGIPLLNCQRDDSYPLIIAGGPCTCNPEPLADFVDLFVIGEGEEVIVEILDCYRQYRADRSKFLEKAALIQGVYVPALCSAEYNDDGTIKGVFWNTDHEPVHIKKRFIKNIENVYYPKAVIIPFTETVHDRVTVELFRGCGSGCRFCQAGNIYRPLREKSLACIEKDIFELVKSTGYEEIALSSLSSGDYSQIQELIHDLVEKYEKQCIGVSLPSLRINSLSIEMLEEIQKIRKSGITLAPEAGTQRMRDVINKGVTENDLISTVSDAFAKGWGHLKLYFMTGLPTETDEDLIGIADLAEKVIQVYDHTEKSMRNKTCKVVVSTSCFVPKPHTPFQWVAQDDLEKQCRKQNLLKDKIKNKKIQYNWHDATTGYYEAIFARGDRRLGHVLLKAHELGCRFDGWQDFFDSEKWEKAFEICGIDGDFYAYRERDANEVFPWDHIDMGVSKKFLYSEWQKALKEELTISCRKGCAGCGIKKFEEGWQCDGNNEIQV